MKICKYFNLNSTRTDVPVFDMETAVDPAKIGKSRNSSTEESSEFADRIMPVIQASLKK